MQENYSQCYNESFPSGEKFYFEKKIAGQFWIKVKSIKGKLKFLSPQIWTGSKFNIFLFYGSETTVVVLTEDQTWSDKSSALKYLTWTATVS